MKKKLKIAIWLPNLTKQSGGAEIYCLNMAEALLKKYEVIIITTANKKMDISDVYKKYGCTSFPTLYVDYCQYSVIFFKSIFLLLRYNKQERQIRDIIDNKSVDIFINGTYGKLKGPAGIKNIQIIHFPANPYKFKRLNNLYLESYDMFVANSHFTEGYMEKYYNHKCSILNPPIKMKPIQKEALIKKENIILAVDRIVPDKKVLEMIDSFKCLVDKGIANYRFVIIGNKDTDYENYYTEVKFAIKGYPIEIYSDIPYEDLVEWYKKAKIFWHAKGYQVNEENPIQMEHFGMTTVEAMANGCIPVVINKAGQKEIVSNESVGFKWDTLDELVNKTEALIKNDCDISSMQLAVIEKSKQYLLPSFEEKLAVIMEKLL